MGLSEAEMSVIKSGKYVYEITDTLLKYKETIFGRDVKIMGHEENSATISIFYSEEIPDAARLADLEMDSSKSSLIMLKELFRYVRENIPQITSVQFEDHLHIENRIPLSLFSILFTGKTWFEQNFNARLKTHHEEYRARVDRWSNKRFEFIEFATAIEHDGQLTNKEFFESVTKERCDFVKDWIKPYMRYHIGSQVYNQWTMPITDFEIGEDWIKASFHLYNADLGISVMDI